MEINLKGKTFFVQMNKFELAEELGISRPTLNTRLEKSNWKKGEEAILRRLILP